MFCGMATLERGRPALQFRDRAPQDAAFVYIARMKRLAIAEYAIFAMPAILLPLSAGLNVFWLIANKSLWGRIPYSIAFIVFILAGLWTLTRVLKRRIAGEAAIGPWEALFLLGGLLASLGPPLYFLLVDVPSRTYPVEASHYVATFLFAWPAPIFAHWLIAGLAARR